MFATYFVEICTGGTEDILAVKDLPIDRIELNRGLELGGLTPELPLLAFAKSQLNVPVICMVRPRTAGFVYSETEYELMKENAKLLLTHGADGIVFGFLKEDRTIDANRTREFTSLIHSYGKEAVFHRAFDETIDPYSSIEILIDSQVDRLLTSGLQPTALEGASLIRSLNEQYGSAISILPGAGINENTVSSVLTETGAHQFHMSAKVISHDRGDYIAVSKQNIQAVKHRLESMNQ